MKTFEARAVYHVERIIDEIEQLWEKFEAPDIRPLSASDICCQSNIREVIAR